MRDPSQECDRVRRHTSHEQLESIERHLKEQIRFYATQPDEVISKRIAELECEWDIERVLETNASALAFTGAVLGLTVNRKWLLLSCAVTAFLFQHAIQGWCPPVPILRKLGVRTQSEIDREKFALKALRGDFEDLAIDQRASDESLTNRLLQSVRM